MDTGRRVLQGSLGGADPDWRSTGQAPRRWMQLDLVLRPDPMWVTTQPDLAPAAQSDIDALSAYALACGLVVNGSDAETRTLSLGGYVPSVERAFAPGLQLQSHVRDQGLDAVMVATQDPSLPAALAPMVQAILGLDERPLLQPPAAAAAPPLRSYGGPKVDAGNLASA